MTTKQPWQERAAQTDFDPKGLAQARVWARVQARPSFAWKRSVAWGVCAAVFITLGAVTGAHWSAKEYTFPSAAHTAPQMLQCKKTGPQFMLSAEIQCDGKNCSCTKKWTDCTCTDSPCVHSKTCRLKLPDFYRQDSKNPADENSKIQSAGLAACQTQC